MLARGQQKDPSLDYCILRSLIIRHNRSGWEAPMKQNIKLFVVMPAISLGLKQKFNTKSIVHREQSRIFFVENRTFILLSIPSFYSFTSVIHRNE